MYLQTKGKSNIRAIHNYAKKAVEGNPNDQKVKDFYNEIKSKYDEFIDTQKLEEEKKPIDEIVEERSKEGE